MIAASLVLAGCGAGGSYPGRNARDMQQYCFPDTPPAAVAVTDPNVLLGEWRFGSSGWTFQSDGTVQILSMTLSARTGSFDLTGGRLRSVVPYEVDGDTLTLTFSEQQRHDGLSSRNRDRFPDGRVSFRFRVEDSPRVLRLLPTDSEFGVGVANWYNASSPDPFREGTFCFRGSE